MSNCGPIDIHSGYAEIEFPGDGLLINAKIDKFLDLSNALSVIQVRDDQRVYAQYYNKMANAINEIQEWFYFDSSAPTGSGSCGEYEYSVTCPLPYGAGFGAVGGDGSVEGVYPSTLFRIKLSDLADYTGPSYSANNSATGSVLVGEVVVTKSSADYSNMPSASGLLVQSSTEWDRIIGDGLVIATAVLAPVRTNGVPSVSPYDSMAASPYNLRSYIHCLRVNSHVVRSPDTFVVRFTVWDVGLHFANLHRTNRYVSSWKTFGADVEVVVAITRVATA